MRKVFRGLLSSFFYNRDDKYFYELLQEVKKRIKGEKTTWSEDGNIIYGFLVCNWGDYGTSPRSGWLANDFVKEEAIKELDQYIKDVLEVSIMDIEEMGKEIK